MHGARCRPRVAPASERGTQRRDRGAAGLPACAAKAAIETAAQRAHGKEAFSAEGRTTSRGGEAKSAARGAAALPVITNCPGAGRSEAGWNWKSCAALRQTRKSNITIPSCDEYRCALARFGSVHINAELA